MVKSVDEMSLLELLNEYRELNRVMGLNDFFSQDYRALAKDKSMRASRASSDLYILTEFT